MSLIREANLADVDSLVEIENTSFQTDRLSKRNFRYLLSKKARAQTLIHEENAIPVAYATLLFNSGTSLARLYSIAVHPNFRGKGIARALLLKIENIAEDNECAAIRLEIKEGNHNAEKLYQKLGYQRIGQIRDYYEDHSTAFRYEKQLIPHLKRELVRVPYYEQTLDFTCGPAALLMAMSSFDPSIEQNRVAEIQIWREATTIFMASGHGGCDPYGLALAAETRGYKTEIFVNDPGTMFIDSVRDVEKKEVISIVQNEFKRRINELDIKLHQRSMHVTEIQERFNEGWIPIVLISSYRIYREKSPHWVVITGFDDRYIYCHDSYVAYEKDRVQTDCINMPILQKDFERMARYGKTGQKAVLLIKKRCN